MSDIGQQSTTSTTFSVHNVSVTHVVPQLSLVLGEATDKDSTASAFSFMRGRGTSRRVIKTVSNTYTLPLFQIRHFIYFMEIKWKIDL